VTAPPAPPAAVVGVELVEQRVGSRFVVAEHDRAAVVGEAEPGEIGPDAVARRAEE
jgi:hypothetical protein